MNLKQCFKWHWSSALNEIEAVLQKELKHCLQWNQSSVPNRNQSSASKEMPLDWRKRIFFFFKHLFSNSFTFYQFNKLHDICKWCANDEINFNFRVFLSWFSLQRFLFLYLTIPATIQSYCKLSCFISVYFTDLYRCVPYLIVLSKE